MWVAFCAADKYDIQSKFYCLFVHTLIKYYVENNKGKRERQKKVVMLLDDVTYNMLLLPVF